jgi:hypothetical protein
VSTVPVAVEGSLQSTVGALVDAPLVEAEALPVSPPVDAVPDVAVVDAPPVDEDDEDAALPPVPGSEKQPTAPARLVK